LADGAQRRERRRSWRTAGAVLGGFVLGAGTVLLVLWLYSGDTPPAPPVTVTPAPTASPAPAPPSPRPEAPPSTGTSIPPAATDLDERTLVIPVAGIRPDQLQDTFDDPRSGERVHEAMDILAPRNTPVVAVEGGRIAKLFTSKLGGLTIYQFDSSESYAYYYAHLEAYAPGLREGDTVRQGDLLGYVGTTGNVGPDNPHLHFAVFVLGPEKRWWEGTPVNPYPLLRRAQQAGG
jgi:murein DD-endopeptidase MepM/ murein hydrolase activator NlpD